MSRPAPSLSYRPDVDGLRAVAVGMVLLFHAGLGFEGGYVGVDLFFVISGYLITALILKAQDAGEAPGAAADAGFSLRQFWSRRVRRIVPAATVMTLATLAVGTLILIPRDLRDLAQSALWQQAAAANVWFYKTTPSGYFASSTDLLPLLHCWSLAVEEQFYLVVPLLLVAWRKLGLHRRFGRRGLAVVATLGVVGSLAAAEYGVSHGHAVFAFYMLPCRAWEMGIGALLAIVAGGERLPRLVREGLTGGGLIAALACGWFLTRDTPFPGLWALPPCLAAAAIIVGGRGGPTLAGRLLSTKPMVFVGLISYSLYLWHWPLLAFLREWHGVQLTLDVQLTALAVSFALGTLSWRFIETPFRRPRNADRPRRWAVPLGYAASVACVALPAAATVLGNGWPDRCVKYADVMAKHARPADRTSRIPEPRVLENAEDFATGRLLAVGLAADVNDAGAYDFLLWGDSHTLALTREVHRQAYDAGLRGVIATRAGTPPGIELPISESPAAWNDRIIALLEDENVPAVLMVSRWSKHFDESADDGRTRAYRDALRDTVATLKADGRQVFVMNQVPEQRRHVCRTLIRYASYGWDLPSGVTRTLHQQRQRQADEAIAGMVAAGATELDAASRFFPDAAPDARCVLSDEAGSFYHDENHLTAHGANVVLAPLLREALSTLAPSAAESDRRNPEQIAVDAAEPGTLR